MFQRFPRPRSPRRGVTLVEMLVAVALLVLMMTILVTIFSAATGAVSGLQSYQELDGNLRQLDSILRQDLQGVTAKLTPPLDPKANLGYFEYIENQFADVQGEDTDDIIRFTAKAPEGQLFTGRCWIGSTTQNAANQPIIVTSQFAEIIYFLRNGNLYRRVLLIAPDKQSSINSLAGAQFQPGMFGSATVSWQGMNDLSARPASSGSTTTPIVLNSLGDLTNRENRFAYPRFSSDYLTNGRNPAVDTPDGMSDDEEQNTSGAVVGNGIADISPTLYPNMIASGSSSLLFEINNGAVTTRSDTPTYQVLAFPYIFPGAYSKPDIGAGSLAGAGWINSVDPSTLATFSDTSKFPSATGTSTLDQLLFLNQKPIDIGDSLPLPQSAQTWWGLPTWRETMSPNWTDPAFAIQVNGRQPNFLIPSDPSGNPNLTDDTTATPPIFRSLPPMTTPYRIDNQPNTDSLGSTALSGSPPTALWNVTWEDDLVMTGVRSFDVKAYDNAFPGYVDLGWGDDLRLYTTAQTVRPYQSPDAPTAMTYLIPPIMINWPVGSVFSFDLYNQTFAHEGRIPPLPGDYRMDPQTPNPIYPNAPFPAYGSYNGNLGDSNTSVIRLRRVWDSWSTEYTEAPAHGFDPTTKLPIGPPFSPPVYPSYPPPYPAPLRGLQVQVRVVDPRNQRVKVLTIRQDFSDKL